MKSTAVAAATVVEEAVVMASVAAAFAAVHSAQDRPHQAAHG